MLGHLGTGWLGASCIWFGTLVALRFNVLTLKRIRALYSSFLTSRVPLAS